MAVKNAEASNWSLTTRSDNRKYSRTDSTAPSAPAIVATVSGTTPESEIDLVVTAGVDANSTVVSHNIYRALTSDGTYSLVTSITGTTKTDANLIALTQYWYKATSVNAFGLESSLSAADDATTTSPQGTTNPWPVQDSVSYTPISRNLRGPGVNTPGGSGRTLNTIHTNGQQVTPSRILKVNSLSAANSGSGDSGTLLYCIERHDSLGGPSTIVFETSGTIDGGASTPIWNINQPLLTIAGESAPSPGIQLTRIKIFVRASDVFISHLTSRYGTTDSGDLDVMELNGTGTGSLGIKRIVLDHCTFMWGDDETFSLVGREYEITIANSIIAEGAGYDEGTGAAHQFLTLIANDGAGATETSAPDEIMFYGTLFASSDERQPLCRPVKYAHVNNINYNWSRRAIDWQGIQSAKATAEAQFLSLAGCNFVNGPSWNGSRKPLTSASPVTFTGSHYYFDDNRWLKAGGVTQTADADLVAAADVPDAEVSPTYWPTGLVAETAANAYNTVLSFVGARPGQRDSVAQRIISEVSARTGSCKVFNLSATGKVSGSTLIGQSDVPSYAVNTASFPAAPAAGGNWYDITATSYTKLEDYLHELEDAVL